MTSIYIPLVIGLIYIGYKSFNRRIESTDNCDPNRYYIMCPMCNRVEEPIDQYGHCSKFCKRVFNENSQNESAVKDDIS
jgi:hypothetical protein